MARYSKSYVITQLVNQLRHQRRNRKMSQVELGQKVGLPQNHISDIESGKTDPRASTLIEIARVLGFEPVLVPRQLLPAVKSQILQGIDQDVEQPLYKLSDDDNAEENNDG